MALTERVDIPFQFIFQNAVISGLKDHSSSVTIFCGDTTLAAGLGEHLIILAQLPAYYSGKQRASVQTSRRQRQKLSLFFSHPG